MSQPFQSELRKAGASTFEELGFVFAEPDLTEEQAGAILAWRSRVVFHGPRSGALEIAFSPGLAAELAANMLGELPPVAPVLIQDAVGEIANVVCGNLVPALGQAGAVFHLEAPLVTPVGPEPSTPDEPSARVVIGAGDGRAELALFLESLKGEEGPQ